MEAIRLRPAERESAAQALVRACFDSPMIAYYWPDLGRRVHYLERYWGCVVNYGLRYGQVYTTPDVTGLSVWLPPGQTHITPWRCSRAGYLALPLFLGFKEFFTRTIKNEGLVQQIHEEIMPGPHWYLWVIAVNRNHQGKGIEMALMRPGLQAADAQHLPCYLETYDVQTIPVYLKCGFGLVRAEQVPGSDLCFWCFRREPRGNQ